MSDKILIATFKKWRGRFLRQAMRMLPSEEDAEDVLQDAFVRLWPKAEEIETENDAAALTSTTIRNLAIDHHRKSQRMTAVAIEGNEPTEEQESRAIAARQELTVVEQLMGRILTKRQQKVIQQREYEGRSFEEIGQVMDMQPTAVRVELSRARKAIREAYQKMKSD